MSERDEQEISQIVEAGFEAILSGKSSVEDVLKKHPDMAAVIRPELEAAVWLVSQRKQVSTRPGYVASSRRRIVERVRQESAAHGKKHALFGVAWPQRFALQSVIAIAVVLVLFLGGSGFFRVAADSVPGEALYPAKRVQEQVVYTLAFSTERQVELKIEFAERRLKEVEVLVKRGNIGMAKTVLEEYKADIEQAAVLIQQVGNDHPEQKKTLAVAMEQSFSEQTERVEALVASAPPELQETFVEASASLSMGITAAVAAGIEADQMLSPDTSTVEPSHTPTETTTVTPTPEQTESQGVSPNAEITSDPGTDQTPSDTIDPNNSVDPGPRVKKSPKPTNENRPTPQPPDSPSNKDNNSNNSNAGPPGEKTNDNNSNK